YLKVASGGVVFTTIQKFLPEEKGDTHPTLSDRRNIIVIADEAHRSQYDFIDGFAKHIRDALPNASFIGFTGTPIEKEDRNTMAVFGNYIDIYDIEQAVHDGATVRIYYESRLAELSLKEEEKPKIDPEFEEVTEGEEVSDREKLKHKWARLEAIVGSKGRIKQIAKDLVEHFEQRLAILEGKGMVVCMSRRIAVELHDEIKRLRPAWYDKEDEKGFVKVIMTGSATDGPEWQEHIRNKERRRRIGDNFKNPANPIKLVIVRDMWLTGFDVPSLHTMYIDKPMKGHGLMQAIARVNRVFKDKPGGLIVDYLGIADELKKALAQYTKSGGKGAPTLDQDEAVAVMLREYEILCGILDGFNYKRFFTAANTGVRMEIIAEAAEHILGLEKGKERYVPHFTMLSKAFALSVPRAEALEIRDSVGFFQAVKAYLTKIGPDDDGGDGKPPIDVDSAIKQIISKAIVSDKVVDIFKAAGIMTPDISILSEEFLGELEAMPRRNLAIELLKKLLNEEISFLACKNLVRSQSFKDLLEESIRKYHAKAIDNARILQELLNIARKMREARKKGEELGLTDDEIAFYDALETNDSAVKILGDEILKQIARDLFKAIKASTSIDWTIKESVQARIRLAVKKILKKYGYPPDKRKHAVETVLKQARLTCHEVAEAIIPAHDDFLSDLTPDFELEESERYVNYLPVYSLSAVAIAFGPEEAVENLGWKRVDSGHKPRKDMFIAKVAGKSMEPTIPDGSYCMFRFEKGGSRGGLPVLVESCQVSDPETFQRYTIKRYKSEKQEFPDGAWQHKKIILSPDNKDFSPIILENVPEGDFHVVAEFVEVIKEKHHA
ncbi:MAG: HsdR family type I site-specific deoxyribonuclease, partial [bacterium]